MTSAPREHARPREAALAVVRTLRDAGHAAFFAGGCVRDELLGLEPKDFDVATDAVPHRVRDLFPRTAEVGAAFGVVLVRHKNVTVEVATFRADGSYSDKRRPDHVTFSDPRADAERRDFTVNALFLDPLEPGEPVLPGHEPSGRVIDYVGGISDLRARVLRAVGDPDRRLAEDHLRALRAARLAAKLGLAIETATADAIRRHARELSGVSRERVGDELRKLMADRSRSRGVELLAELGLDAHIAGPHPAGPATAPARLIALSPAADFPTCLAAWALDRGLEVSDNKLLALVREWRRGMCLSNQERDALAGALRVVQALRERWATLGVAGRKRLAAGPDFAAGLAVRRAEDPGAAAGIDADIAELTKTGLAPPPLLTGDDLVARGWTPGPVFKRVLDAAYDEQLEGRLTDPEAAVRWAEARRAGAEPRP